VLALFAATLAVRVEAEPRRGSIHPAECVEQRLDVDEVAKLLSLEVTGEFEVVARRPSADDSGIVVVLGGYCTENEPVAARLIFSGQALGRRIVLRDLPAELRARALALTLGETLSSLEFDERVGPTRELPEGWQEVAPEVARTEFFAPTTPDLESFAPPARLRRPSRVRELAHSPRESAEAPDWAEAARPGWSLAFNVQPLLYLSEANSLVGGSARLGYGHLELDGVIAVGNATDALGEVDLWLVALRAAYAMPVAQGAVLDVALVPRLAAGALHARAHAGPGILAETVTDPYVEASMIARASIPLSSAWQLEVGLGGGYSRGFKLRADERLIAAFDGWMVTGELGLRFDLSKLGQR
jgi:hypothetical protein